MRAAPRAGGNVVRSPRGGHRDDRRLKRPVRGGVRRMEGWMDGWRIEEERVLRRCERMRWEDATRSVRTPLLAFAFVLEDQSGHRVDVLKLNLQGWNQVVSL